jgi:UDP-N-acetylmuramoyl-tripeptide--D-alanyl-D-alanine ligase
VSHNTHIKKQKLLELVKKVPELVEVILSLEDEYLDAFLDSIQLTSEDRRSMEESKKRCRLRLFGDPDRAEVQHQRADAQDTTSGTCVDCHSAPVEMVRLTIDEIANAINARLIGKPGRKTASGVSTNTREIRAGSLFFALRSKRYDGHEFVGEAMAKGAVAAVVARDSKVSRGGEIPLLVVEDTTKALMALAGYYRGNRHATVVAITGSNGKTTVKDMIYHILSGSMPTVKSPLSFNNDIGVPLTLLSIEAETKVAVVEHGTNNPGEIKALVAVSKPDIGVVTNVSQTHFEGLSSAEGVAKEKSDLIRALPTNGIAVLNREDSWFEYMREAAQCRVITTGFSPECDWWADDTEQMPDKVRFSLNGKHQITMPILGKHNVANALAAIAVATTMGVTIEEIAVRLATFQAPRMRLQKEMVEGVTIINDACNANPFSIGAAVAFLDSYVCTGKKILVLGDMGELGRESRSIHRSMGKAISASDVDYLFTIGRDARNVSEAARETGKKMQAEHFEDFEQALSTLDGLLREGDVILFKASRHIQLERLIEALKPRLVKSATRNRVQDAACHSVVGSVLPIKETIRR